MIRLFGLLALLLLNSSYLLPPTSLQAQEKRESINGEHFRALSFRHIGPFRGGRSVAVSGVRQDPMVYYMGTTGGGMWKTEDAGISWKNISDGQFKMGSVGAIGVAESDPNVIYVGMGEHAIRGVMTSHGDGVYKSVDGGKSWKHVGLEKSKHISDVIVHPTNPNIVFVSAQGGAHGPNEERGIYRTIDGGVNWEKVLYIDENTGASGLSMDMTNPRILYAAMWEHTRYPWKVLSGGEGSGLYKSTDGGTNWVKLKKGLPATMGKAGISVLRANPNRVFAIIEADESGLYRSDNGGMSWQRVNKDRIAVTRSWYYMEVFADPQNEDVVYVINAPMLKSIDGGKTLSNVPVPHGDNHDLWIHPDDNQTMINANDGGSNISFNGGKSWSTQQNQPTVQFYRVITDNRFPYYVYGGQQDNSTVAIASRTNGRGIGWKGWYAVSGGESAFIDFDDPDNPRYVYGGSYQGNISVLDHQSMEVKDIMAYPVVGLGSKPKEMKYRFNWNAPIIVSDFDKQTIYHGAQMVLKSTDKGLSWEEISPDLTRNEKEKQDWGGGPFTNEGAGGENYNTISYMVESPHKQGELWVGTDDGLLHKTTDGGTNWENITPKKLPEGIINSIDISLHDAQTAYITFLRYKLNDYTPYAYKTTNGGKDWELITEGIEEEMYVRVVREDPKRKDLLYAGTENGLYLSFDGGKQWEKYPFNLSSAPINDLTFQNNDLVLATSGRGFWILDDLSALQQVNLDRKRSAMQLFEPKETVRWDVPVGPKPPSDEGQNPMNGVIIDYFLSDAIADSVELKLEIRNEVEELIRSYSNQKDNNFKSWPGGPQPEAVLSSRKGINRFAWDMRHESLPPVDGVFVLGDYRGSIVPPGMYSAHLILGDQKHEVPIKLLADPRIEANEADFQDQYELMLQAGNAVREMHAQVNRMRKANHQLVVHKEMMGGDAGYEELTKMADQLIESLSDWERALIQPDQETFQDVINFPNQLNAEFMNLKQRVDGAHPQVTEGAKARLQDLLSAWQAHKSALDKIIKEDIAAFNNVYREREVPAIILEKE